VPIDEVRAHGRNKGVRRGGARARQAREEAKASCVRAKASTEDEALASVGGKGKEASFRAEVRSLDAGAKERREAGEERMVEAGVVEVVRHEESFCHRSRCASRCIQRGRRWRAGVRSAGVGGRERERRRLGGERVRGEKKR
jgi:hypothetical protein